MTTAKMPRYIPAMPEIPQRISQPSGLSYADTFLKTYENYPLAQQQERLHTDLTRRFVRHFAFYRLPDHENDFLRGVEHVFGKKGYPVLAEIAASFIHPDRAAKYMSRN